MFQSPFKKKKELIASQGLRKIGKVEYFKSAQDIGFLARIVDTVGYNRYDVAEPCDYSIHDICEMVAAEQKPELSEGQKLEIAQVVADDCRTDLGLDDVVEEVKVYMRDGNPYRLLAMVSAAIAGTQYIATQSVSATTIALFLVNILLCLKDISRDTKGIHASGSATTYLNYGNMCCLDCVIRTASHETRHVWQDAGKSFLERLKVLLLNKFKKYEERSEEVDARKYEGDYMKRRITPLVEAIRVEREAGLVQGDSEDERVEEDYGVTNDL